jgi:hypothetical protein
MWTQQGPNGKKVHGPVVHLGFWADKACDRCGEVGDCGLINGVGRQDWRKDEPHPGFSMLSTLIEHETRPSRLLEFSISLCRACLKEAIARTYEGGRVPESDRFIPNSSPEETES